MESIITESACNQLESKKYLGFKNSEFPDDITIIYDNNDNKHFYKYNIPLLSQEEIKEYIYYKKLNQLKTIRSCVLFFTICVVIGIVLKIVSFANILN